MVGEAEAAAGVPGTAVAIVEERDGTGAMVEAEGDAAAPSDEGRRVMVCPHLQKVMLLTSRESPAAVALVRAA